MKRIIILFMVSVCLIFCACGKKKTETVQAIPDDVPEDVVTLMEESEDAVDAEKPIPEEAPESVMDTSEVRDEDVISVGEINARIDGQMHLIITDTDNKTEDKGYIGGESKPAEHSVCFVDYDGTPLKVEFVQKGGSATPPVDPMRNGLDFLGWQGCWTDIQEDTVIYATYTASGKYYTVSYLDENGTLLCAEKVPVGSCSKGFDAPEKDGFTFAGWENAVGVITEDVSFTAVYAQNSDFIVSMNSSVVKPGEMAEMVISFQNCPGMCGISLNLETDSNISLSDYDFIEDVGGMGTGPSMPTKQNEYKFNWFNIEKEVTGDSEFLNLSFKVNKNAPTGVYWVRISYDEGEAVNIQEANLNPSVICGQIVVTD